MQQGEVGSGDLNNSSYNWSLLSWGLFFFQLNSWPSVAAQLSGCRLLSAMQCPLPGLMGWLRDKMSSRRRGVCVTKTRMWVCARLWHMTAAAVGMEPATNWWEPPQHWHEQGPRTVAVLQPGQECLHKLGACLGYTADQALSGSNAHLLSWFCFCLAFFF